MGKNKGFIGIYTLIIMAVSLLFSLFLLNMAKMEYLVTKISENYAQSYYEAESKVHLILNHKKYYDPLLEEIKHYLKNKDTIKGYSCDINIDEDDLLPGGKAEKIKIYFKKDKSREFLEFASKGSYNGTSSAIRSKVSLVNKFYELGDPIVEEDTILNKIKESAISKNSIEDYREYLELIQENIEISNESSDIMEIDLGEYPGYDEIRMSKGLDGKICFKFFRNNNLELVKEYNLINDRPIFLIARNKNQSPINLYIESEDDREEFLLKGTFYIEGNLNICSNIEMQGILIINNGSFYIESSKIFKLEGLVLLNNYHGEAIEVKDNVQIIYNDEIILKNGEKIPGFIDPKIQVIKIKK